MTSAEKIKREKNHAKRTFFRLQNSFPNANDSTVKLNHTLENYLLLRGTQQ